MLSENNYRKCNIAVNLLKLLNKEVTSEIAVCNTSVLDVQHLMDSYCNVKVGHHGSLNDRSGVIVLAGLNRHKKSELETKAYLESIVKKYKKEYDEQVKMYEALFGMQ